ncbi:hypothetical protein J437_LFUL002934 [Ladona fulva]|uniref:Zinc transporter ZIP1 n=1 Tax=Ladona fulva TaxID=123851 RepID=A0A8K0KAP5_LADFU|nr:hypothetical protein J437_LFUL002934 [Ladona fulva]
MVPEEKSSSAFLLLLALSIHSTIEGFAIGVESSARSVLFMLLAVSMHKFVMAFCLGMEMSLPENPLTLRRAAAFLGVFSLTSVLGVFGGILLRMDEQVWGELVCSVLQALAAGALLHVALLEILPRERSRCHQIGLSQFSSVSSGFGLSLLLQYFSD